MKKKYKLIPSDKEGLYRIQALRNFGAINKDDIGGYVESEDNLSHKGKCWIYYNAMAINNAKVNDNALLYDNAIAKDNAIVKGNASIGANCIIQDNATASDNCYIRENSIISGDSMILDAAFVYNSKINGNSIIMGVVKYSTINGESRVYKNALVDNTSIINNTNIASFAVINSAIVNSIKDYIIFKNWWSSGRFFTWTRCNNMWSVGCFYGTGEQLIEKAYQDSEETGIQYKKIVDYVNSII